MPPAGKVGASGAFVGSTTTVRHVYRGTLPRAIRFAFLGFGTGRKNSRGADGLDSSAAGSRIEVTSIGGVLSRSYRTTIPSPSLARAKMWAVGLKRFTAYLPKKK